HAVPPHGPRGRGARRLPGRESLRPARDGGRRECARRGRGSGEGRPGAGERGQWDRAGEGRCTGAGEGHAVRWLLLAAFVGLAGCAGTQVRSQTTATDGLIGTARDNGAKTCAPVELAMAESHNDYAQHALDEGNYYDAAREADVAQHNAKLAFDHSPREKCVPK